MTYREIVAEIERLPQAEQQALLQWLVKHARIETRRDHRSAPPASALRGIALMGEPALKKDWDRPEEDEAWANLDQIPPI
jgi:hypothetical protein